MACFIKEAIQGKGKILFRRRGQDLRLVRIKQTTTPYQTISQTINQTARKNKPLTLLKK